MYAYDCHKRDGFSCSPIETARKHMLFTYIKKTSHPPHRPAHNAHPPNFISFTQNVMQSKRKTKKKQQQKNDVNLFTLRNWERVSIQINLYGFVCMAERKRKCHAFNGKLMLCFTSIYVALPFLRLLRPLLLPLCHGCETCSHRNQAAKVSHFLSFLKYVIMENLHRIFLCVPFNNSLQFHFR